MVYKIVSVIRGGVYPDSVEELEKQVNLLLLEGYQPQGGICKVGSFILQAMVFEEKY